MLRKLYPNIYEGWIVVGSAGVIVLVVAATFFYGFGTIYNEVRGEFGWKNSETALAFSLRNEVGGIGAILVGIALDRIGPKRVLFVGIIVTASGVFAMSFMQQIWHFYVVMIVIALGSSAAAGQVGLTAVATWFQVRRAFAMSIMTLGGGLGGLFVVGIAWIVEIAGWRDALRLLALVMIIVGFAVGSNVRSRPANHHQLLDGVKHDPEDGDPPVASAEQWGVPVMVAIRSRAFILLSVALLGSSFGFVSLVVHQIPYFETQIGVSKSVAGGTIAVFTLLSIIGRVGFGWLADRYSKRLMMAGAMASLSIGLVVLGLAPNFWVAVAGVAIAAPGFGGTIPLRPSMTADYFGTKNFGTLNGTVQFISTTGGAAGPWIVGYIVDVNGSYTEGWLISAAVVALVGIPSILFATPPTSLMTRYRDAETPTTTC
jgi:MFS family permease